MKSPTAGRHGMSFLYIKRMIHFLNIIITNVGAFSGSHGPHLECFHVPVLTEGPYKVGSGGLGVQAL